MMSTDLAKVFILAKIPSAFPIPLPKIFTYLLITY